MGTMPGLDIDADITPVFTDSFPYFKYSPDGRKYAAVFRNSFKYRKHNGSSVFAEIIQPAEAAIKIT